MKALTELFIGAVLAVIDSVTEVGYKSLPLVLTEGVALENTLFGVLAEPVAIRTEVSVVSGGQTG